MGDKTSAPGTLHPFAQKIVDLELQSVLLDGPERIHVSPQCNLTDREYVMKSLYDDVSTSYDAFLRGEQVSNDGPCLGWRPSGKDPYSWMKYSEVRQKAQCFGSALLEMGFSPSDESKIGIYSQNRPEWVIVDLGCVTFSMVSTPLYSTLGPQGCQHIINLTKMRLIVVDTVQKATDLLDEIDKIPNLRHIVVMETAIPDEAKERAEKAGLQLLIFDDILDEGFNHLKEPVPSKPKDLALIRFTSGTTGVPKGAMITQANIISNLSAMYAAIWRLFSFPPGCVSISYLPLAHAYEHALQGLMFMHGGSVGFFRGDIKELTDDMQALKPDIFPCVPRLANRLYDKIMGGVNSASFIKRTLFHWAFNKKKADADKGIIRRDTWSDSIVFKRFQDLLGGNLTWIITASAPISSDVMVFLRVVFGCEVTEAYGQTEAMCGLTCMVPGEVKGGHVGAPFPCTMIKLVDVPEMGYLAAEDKGEICAKGPNVFMGYYENPELTAEVLDSDDWLHTGDIGEWLSNGALRVIDRKKHHYKLSQGEYVAPEKVENVMTRSPLIAQAFVCGDSLKSSNVAILVPDEEELLKFSENNGLAGRLEDLCRDETVISAVRSDLDRASTAAKLRGFERVNTFVLHPVPFSIENGLLTPTMKNVRIAIKDHFQSEIVAMCAGLD